MTLFDLERKNYVSASSTAYASQHKDSRSRRGSIRKYISIGAMMFSSASASQIEKNASTYVYNEMHLTTIQQQRAVALWFA